MDTEKHVQHIVNWLKEYKDQAGAKGGVVGLSGGLIPLLSLTS